MSFILPENWVMVKDWVLVEWRKYLIAGTLCGYLLSSILFFENRLSLFSLFFVKFCFWMIIAYGLLGFMGGGIAWFMWKLVKKIPFANRIFPNLSASEARTQIFVGLSLFAILFFWNFDSFYQYSSFNFDLLVKLLLTESFVPITAYGFKNLLHLLGLVLIASSVVWVGRWVKRICSDSSWNKLWKVMVGVFLIAPWGVEGFFRLSSYSDVPELLARPGRKVLIIGIDAFDWKMSREIMGKGGLPNLQPLAEAGIFSPLNTFVPAYSPMVWTTLATGKTIAQHNIRHFKAYTFSTPASIQPLVEPSLLLGNPYVLRWFGQLGIMQVRSVTGNSRQVPAFWDITSRAGLSTVVLGWWGTSPAEPVNGILVSDYVPHTDGSLSALLPHVFPESVIPQVAKHLEAGGQFPERWLRSLFNLTPQEEERLELNGRIEDIKPMVIREILRSLRHDRSFFLMARQVMATEQPDVLAVFLEGIDTVGHLALHFERSMDKTTLDSVEVRRYEGANRAYYQIVDEMVGELTRLADSDTYIMILADHGFTLERPPNYFHHKTGPPGIFSFCGPTVVPPPPGEIKVHIYDIMPTLLYTLGLPVGGDMKGRVITEAYADVFKQRYGIDTIASYDPLRLKQHQVEDMFSETAHESQVIVQRLKALGYIE